jgi:type I restriction enzyme S subunit
VFWNRKTFFDTGTSQPQITITNIEKLNIAFPKEKTQKLIADKLDSLLAKVKDAGSRIDRIPLILKQFRQSILASAFSGELTKDWREAKGIKDEWRYCSIGDVINDLKYGTSKKCLKEKKKHAVLRIPNVVQGYIDLEDLKYTDLPDKEYEKLRLQAGDILLIRSNGSVSLVGKTALVASEAEDMAYAGYLIRLRLKKDLILPEFLQYQFQTYTMRIQIELPARSTSGVNNINSDEVKNLKISLPSTDEQKEVVKKLHSYFEFLRKNKQEYLKAKRYVDKLEQSILAKAFRGELVS